MLALLAGLFLMHGLTASPSPVHVTEPVLMAAHETMDHTAGAAVTASPGGMAGHTAGCAAGTICFALLAMALAFAVALGRPATPPPLRTGPSWGRVRRRGPPRARPPTCYSLCVLRL
ncbi:hypothetical protein ACRB68_20910 [Actinomadura sp. RB68]|uniref:Uncharacterized protein n=1 Tax=Actinomadura macrotermitis TaxID=2585200 RepID=A0A7K0BT21_9ACTN|nr:hypothetical protein [Actinomadura macrotermitis]